MKTTEDAKEDIWEPLWKLQMAKFNLMLCTSFKIFFIIFLNLILYLS